MEPSVYGLFLLIIIILIGSACCSGVEAAFLAVNSIRILEIASRQKPKSSANQLLKLRKHLGRTLTVITITNNGFNIIGSLVLGVFKFQGNLREKIRKNQIIKFIYPKKHGIKYLRFCQI